MEASLDMNIPDFVSKREQSQPLPPFTYAIVPCKYRPGHVVAFIHWTTVDGQSCHVGSFTGFGNEEELREAAEKCVTVLNGSFSYAASHKKRKTA